jgi:hypothetical protein
MYTKLSLLIYVFMVFTSTAQAVDADDIKDWFHKAGPKISSWFAKTENKIEHWIESVLLNHPDCTREELLMALPYARLVFASDQIRVEDAQVSGWSLIRLEELCEFLSDYWINQECWMDDDICVETHTLEGLGVRARIYEKKNAKELVVVFTGSEMDFDRFDRVVMNWMSNVLLSLGKPSYAYGLASKWIAALIARFPNHKIVFTGQSFGAGIAQYLGSLYKLPAVCFNSPGIRGKSLETIRKKWNSDDFDKATKGIQHIHVSGEILNLPIQILPGRLLGKICEVEAHDIALSPLDRHKSEHVLRSIEYKLM